MSNDVPKIGPVKIQIKKDEGITQTLKKLVEAQKMELSDGKITAKEWNVVLDKLVELQEARKAQGKTSIFTGGTDKTRAGWHNSFVVHPNQDIELTAEEASALYEAMGAKFTKDSTPVEYMPASGAPKAGDAPKADGTPKNGDAPKAGTGQEEPGPNGTVIKDGKYYSNGTEVLPGYARGQEIKDENGNFSARIWENGERVTYRDKDGKLMKHADFMKKYPEGYVQIIAGQLSAAGGDAVEGAKLEFQADESGALTGATVTLNGKTVLAKLPMSVKNVLEKFGIEPKKTEEKPAAAPAEKPENTPAAEETPKNGDAPKVEEEKPAQSKDLPAGVKAENRKNEDGIEYVAWVKDGKEIKQIHNQGTQEEYSISIEYDSNGKVTKETKTRGDGTTSYVEEYNSGEKLAKRTFYEGDGKTVDSVYTYDYDSNGKVTKETGTRGDGTTSNVGEYNSGGKLAKGTFYEGDGKTVAFVDTYDYDSNGKVTKETKTRGDGTTYYVEEYNSGEKLAKRTFYEDDGKTVDSVHTYDYDSNGNVTKDTGTRGDGTTSYVGEYNSGEKLAKRTFYEDDGKTVDFVFTYDYDSNGNVTKETRTRGDGTTSYVEEYNSGEIRRTNYKSDGKTISRVVINDIIAFQHITSPTADGKTTEHTYTYDENGICTESSLANILHGIISGPSFNSSTIARLKEITPANVLKVLASYQKIAGVSLQDAIKDEWGLGEDEVAEYITKNLEERKKMIADPDKEYSFEELCKLDNKYS